MISYYLWRVNLKAMKKIADKEEEKKMLDVGVRISIFLMEERIPKQELAEKLGVQSETISRITNRRGTASFPIIYKMLEIYPRLSAEWLIRGKGKMYGVEKPNDDQVLMLMKQALEKMMDNA